MENNVIDLKAKRKKETKPVYLKFKALIDPVTKQQVMALIADSQEDREILKARNYREGDRVRAELKKPRHAAFHRLVHRLGTLVSQNIDGFENMEAHQVIKKIQKDGQVFCDAEIFDLGDLGTVTRHVPQSIAFDSMDDAEFYQFWQIVCQYLINTYWHDLTPEKIEEMAGAMSQEAI
ncbi:hypothetical protein DM558_06340 [Entomomonas moraniae]|uniref:DUF1367 family protein n=1 Tax=Entomomonas moraniae TaxID=2213226 RepID=A0A3Q9JIQ8_9GAMM|nr:hypothetical protein [Entomomonas moraniae]AZS50417.1 hypothetical protein DM558_06340 [Entomomonas moraniae]